MLKLNSSLNGLQILLTRQAQNNTALANKIRALQGTPVELPLLAIESLLTPQSLHTIAHKIAVCNICICISRNAAELLIPELDNIPSCAWATIGPATAHYLHSLGIAQVVTATQAPFDSQALLQAMQLHSLKIAKQYIIVMTGADGDNWLQTALSDLGAVVETIPIYRRVLPVCAYDQFISIFNAGVKIDIILISCITSLVNLIHMAQVAQIAIFRLPLLVVSQRIYAYATAQGFKNVYVAQSMTDDSILLALERLGRAHAEIH